MQYELIEEKNLRRSVPTIKIVFFFFFFFFFVVVLLLFYRVNFLKFKLMKTGIRTLLKSKLFHAFFRRH